MGQRTYRALGEIARGGMGAVLRGDDVELGRAIAIKVTDVDRAKNPEVVERFIVEAQIGVQLQHPGIVPVYELGLMEGQRRLVTMKFIKVRTLAVILTRRKFRRPRADEEQTAWSWSPEPSRLQLRPWSPRFGAVRADEGRSWLARRHRCAPAERGRD